MQKIIIPISKCIPGMITAQPILDLKTGTVIIGQNQVLTQETLQNIDHFIHTDVWVYLDSSSKVWNLPPEAIQNYKKYSHALESIIGSPTSPDTINMQDFEQLCNHIPIDFKSNYSLLGCTNLIEQLDYNTYRHSLNVAFICTLICRWNHLSEETSALAVQAALLHDVGMLNLPFKAHHTVDALTAEEIMEYEKHPIYSYNIVSKIKNLNSAIAKAILAHHECCDGSGFPIKLTSPYISELGKILGLANAYESLRTKHHIFETLRILLREDLSKYDPKLLLTFCNTIANYYIGVFVTLSTGEIGEVVFINPKCIYRPIVKINDHYINLYEESSIQIITIE